MNILITGASGYVGKAVVKTALENGHYVKALSRRGTISIAQDNLLERLEPIAADIADLPALRQACKDVDAIIHLVGIIREQKAKGISFEHVHVEGTRNVVTAALDSGVQRYIHMSALGVENADLCKTSGYMATKAEAERIVKSTSLNWTIFRPSLIFGQGDEFFSSVMRDLVTLAPVIPQIGDGSFLFKPVWKGDVAAAFVQALESEQSIHHTYDLIGPEEYSFRELLELERTHLNTNSNSSNPNSKKPQKPIVPIPLPLMKLAVPLMQILPNPPITKDQFAMLLAGNTSQSTKAQEHFKLSMTNLETKLPDMLQ